MVLTKAEWVKEVMRVMNELGWDDDYSGAFIGSDTTQVEEHASSVFRDAWRKAQSLVPKSYFLTKDITNSVFLHHEGSEGTGFVPVPSDFYRLSRFQLKGWKMAVFEYTEMSEGVMKIQSNEYTRAGVCRPACVLDSRDITSGEAKMYYFSLPKGMPAELKAYEYIPLVEDIDKTGTATIDERLLSPLAYIAGSIVYALFEKPDAAAALLQQVQPIA